LRFAVLLPATLSNAVLRNAIRSLCSLAGGTRSVLVPATGAGVVSEWLPAVRALDPDCVLVSRSLWSQAYKKRLSRQLETNCFIGSRSAFAGQVRPVERGTLGNLYAWRTGRAARRSERPGRNARPDDPAGPEVHRHPRRAPRHDYLAVPLLLAGQPGGGGADQHRPAPPQATPGGLAVRTQVRPVGYGRRDGLLGDRGLLHHPRQRCHPICGREDGRRLGHRRRSGSAPAGRGRGPRSCSLLGSSGPAC